MGFRSCGFKSRPRHHPMQLLAVMAAIAVGSWSTGHTKRRVSYRQLRGDVAKWTKAEVCKTSIRRFESARRLQFQFIHFTRRRLRPADDALHNLPISTADPRNALNGHALRVYL